ncbi:hypothetical protein RJT34_19481 [Clitoria ternatea]|uniref:TRAF-type domain-containing protein n=1 Tax=Clitoria ternatea TaxID=43366 RepID=A0AAN9IRA1_CLITE
MSILSSMDMPTVDVDLEPNKIEDEKQGGPLVHCDLCDTEVVHKLAQMFLPGLASACVDNTSGDLFKTPGSVVNDLRKEMIEYITQRSESFVAESVILEGGPDGEVSDHPFDIISNFVDDYASLKRNLFSRVSGWVLSEKREDNIDDFIQEIEMNGFWMLERREKLAETLLKNVDFENSYHCSMSFNSEEELSNHVEDCKFRSMICNNEGCNARFCAAHLEKHDSTCPFKIIPCEQKCSDSIMRREMDRHCITVCPMKLINCPFYTVGCRSAIAQCMIEKHRLDDVKPHLWHLLKGTYKEAYGDDIQRRVDQIVEASSISRLAQARDVRSLKSIVKGIEAKLGPFKASAVEKDSAEAVAKNDEKESSVEKDSAEAVAKNDDKERSGANANETEQTQQSTRATDNKSADKVKVSDIVNVDSAENPAKNENNEPSHVENKVSEERTHTSNMANLPEKAEIGHLNDDTAQIYNENKDAAASELKIKGGEESTQKTNIENLSKEEISATSEGSVETSIKGRYDEESKFEDKDSEQSIHDSKMETKGGAENVVKNKDTEDDNLKKGTQNSEE